MNKLAEEMRTPYERAVQEIERLNTLRANGLAEETYQRALQRQGEILNRQERHQDTQLAAGLTAGSAQAISLVNQINANANDPQRDLLALARQEAAQNGIARTNTREMRDVIRELFGRFQPGNIQ